MEVLFLSGTALWCNGNTPDFDSVILGSSPSKATIFAFLEVVDGAEVRGEQAFVCSGGVAICHAGEVVANEASAGGFM